MSSSTGVALSSVSKNLRKVFLSQKTRKMDWRFSQLKALKKLISENKEDITAAVKKDLGKHEFEIHQTEIVMVQAECEETISHLESWNKTEKVYSPIHFKPGSSYILKEPLGVVLIMSPWNYPVNLALVPLIGAIAGGNCALVKLSRHSYNVSKLLYELLTKYMDPECFVFDYEGGAQYITELLEYKWDHIFFTGSVKVGKIVYAAAAKYLTPVTLELGGKNPCIVDKDTDIKFTARRLIWGKCWNAGQTCIGLDYLLVHKSILQPLIEEFKSVLKEFFGEDIKKSPSFARIISKAAAERLASLFTNGKVVIGGEADIEERYISPTVIVDPDLDSPLMTEEIFGPVLPIVAYENIDEAIEFIQNRPHPLTLYCFSRDQSIQDKVLDGTQSGSVMLNDCLLHFTNPQLPFGGIGDSGIGAYHGKLTFDTFTHRRALVQSTTKKFLDLPLRYPPYTPMSDNIASKIIGSGW
ncbi:aldehyde dehydrogenase [Dictyostelium purpureum]|uniref:Aldehyde dehydrogenase n=1 Tax=Dictyostelium purpureum TaxID=5786 RepID=F0ZGT1_DICPU|nr:aldehyde dehydrogenase [Dictyostelium purpureum]EGC36848.1 aldehyde dehydrogenase [Dictyostelium purpureum]|eukprot:XP_003286646.1 aldehyde dehydrogenase [Dictyostelium purpureum]